MAMTDLNSLFSRAERAFVAGRLPEARRDLLEVARLAGEEPAVLHLLALVEKRSGNAVAAAAAFARAAARAPGDAQIANNYANLLAERGEHERALALYDRAVAAQPGFRDARFNRALLLQKLGRLEEALAALDRLAADSGSADAKLEAARGGVLFALGRMDEAAKAFDAALARDPARLVALHGRARVAMERGESDASARYARAMEQAPGDPELLLGMAEALEAEGDPGGFALLREAVERQPGWIAGHEALARMRSEAGENDGIEAQYRAALEARPHDPELRRSYWTMLARADRFSDAAKALRDARSLFGENPSLTLTEALYTSEAGDPDSALSLLDGCGQLTGSSAYPFVRGRIALRARQFDEAARLLEQAATDDPGSIAAWANLDLAWRLTDDARHLWLSGQPGLYGWSELDLSPAELERLASLLRGIHRARAHPIGQSMRRGTQTRGNLLQRTEPALRRLREALIAAVNRHMAGLPPRDESHPLLRHRNAPVAIRGSWSVRLSGQGFHVSHVHPEGLLSSACYIALPTSLGGEESRDGWLELGSPPRELDLPLGPLATIEPKPGRLALFPSYLFHGTRPFAEGERLSVAFDVAPR